MIFDYPDARLHRRHAPRGYSHYRKYRPWLRDEFSFRCVYCLKRETWGQVTGEFDIDHFQPQSVIPSLAQDYENLVYACRRCNAEKSDQGIGDPFDTMTARRIVATPDGTVWGADNAAEREILALDLNSPRLVEWRVMWMRIVELAREQSDELWRRIVGFPRELPRLHRLRPPGGNSRPEGVAKSWAAKADRGELPESY